MTTPLSAQDESYAEARQRVRGGQVREEDGPRRVSELELQARIAGGS